MNSNTEHLLDLTDNQFYSEENPWFSCNILSQTQTITDLSRGDHIHNHAILWAITLHSQTQQIFSTGTHVEEENMYFCMDTDSLEKRLTQQKAGRQGKGDRILNNELDN